MADDRTILALYCGPSLDGVDAALLHLTGSAEGGTFELIGSLQRPLSVELADRMRSPGSDPEARTMLEQEMVAAARSAMDLGRGNSQPEAIGVETDLPGESANGSLIGPAALSREFGATCVAGFSSADRLLGGSQAGVLAWGLWRWFGDARLSRVIVRLGAAAHVTFLPAGAPSGDVLSFDAAPACSWLDTAARTVLTTPFDRDGSAASRGRPDGQLAHRLLHDIWSTVSGPARLEMSECRDVLLPRMLTMAEQAGVDGDDLPATVCEATAEAVHQAVSGLTERPHQVILCGGGALNIHLATRIRARLTPSSTIPSDKLGVPSRAVASAAVGILAAARLDGVSAHCPAATGASGRGILGQVVLPPAR